MRGGGRGGGRAERADQGGQRLEGEEVAKQQANKQIKQKAMQGPGRVVTAVRTPDITDGEFTVLRVPGAIRFTVFCQAGQMNFSVYNISPAPMRMSGHWLDDGGDMRFREGEFPGNGNGFWTPVGGNGGGAEASLQATSANGKAVGLTMTFHPITGVECPVGAQAVVTG